MTAPNMTTITASIERSLQNCSLNNHQHQTTSSTSSSSGSSNSTGGIRPQQQQQQQQQRRSSDSPENLSNNNSIELNSQVPLPYYWEQCLDLKTGEVYFINWRTGMKSQEDPRINPDINCEFYNSEEDDSCYDSEGSSSESSSREQEQYKTTAESNINERAQVLVAAGCKSCLMYFMVPKQAEDCPKCYGQLLHFDRSENTSP